MSDSRTGKSLDNLREAFIALEKSEVPPSHGGTAPCLTLIRLRDLAINASLTTQADVRHLKTCRKCTVRLRAMQSELGTDPQTTFDAAITDVQLSLSRFAYAEPRARELFHRLHAHREEPDRIFTWHHVHDPILALRDHHGPGGEEDAESIVAMTMIAIRCALADPSTPFAHDLDAAWPVITMIRSMATETRSDRRVAARFAAGYAGIVRVAPVPLRAALTYALRMLIRSPQLEHLAIDIAARIAKHDDPAAESILIALSNTEWQQLTALLPIATRRQVNPELLTVTGWLHDLEESLRTHVPFSGIVSTIQKNVCELVAKMLEEEDPVSSLPRLLRIRHYLAEAACRMSGAARHTFEFFMGGPAQLVMESAQLADRRFFIAVEVLSAIGPNPSVIRTMTGLLDTPDPALRQALFVYFLELSERAPAATHPLSIFGDRAATMAKDDPEIAALIDWSRLHLEQQTARVKKEAASV